MKRGNTHDREIFGPRSLGKGAWPDGIDFDSYGNLWGTSVYSDKLFVLTPQGDPKILLDEGDPGKVDAFGTPVFRRPGDPKRPFRNRPGNRTLDGQRHLRRTDLRTVYIGSLKGNRIPCFQSPIPGLPMVHWR